MAKPNGDLAPVIASWSKAQKTVEDASIALDQARQGQQGYAKAIYSELGSEPFSVKSLGRSYRAIHKKARKNDKGADIAESWHVIPLPANEPVRAF